MKFSQFLHWRRTAGVKRSFTPDPARHGMAWYGTMPYGAGFGVKAAMRRAGYNAVRCRAVPV